MDSLSRPTSRAGESIANAYDSLPRPTHCPRPTTASTLHFAFGPCVHLSNVVAATLFETIESLHTPFALSPVTVCLRAGQQRLKNGETKRQAKLSRER